MLTVSYHQAVVFVLFEANLIGVKKIPGWKATSARTAKAIILFTSAQVQQQKHQLTFHPTLETPSLFSSKHFPNHRPSLAIGKYIWSELLWRQIQWMHRKAWSFWPSLDLVARFHVVSFLADDLNLHLSSFGISRRMSTRAKHKQPLLPLGKQFRQRSNHYQHRGVLCFHC